MNIDITSSLRRALWETLIGNQQLVLDIGCGDGKITALYSSERKSKRLAIQAARNLSGKTFSQISEKTIQVKCTCKNFDDLYASTISNHPNPNWNLAIEKTIKGILDKCEVTSTGEIVIDYYTTVFSYLKRKHPSV